MKFGKFISYTLGILFLSILLHSYVFALQNQELQLLNSIAIFFAIFCVGMFLAIDKTRNSTDLNLFTRIFMISVFVKMVIFIFIIIFGIRKMDCNRELIILPSIVLYILFTSFETYFLMIMSKRR
ncbi:MAG: hypothetical protein HOP11_13720 [Saprospiraceae bacterium]|nr:hypothetical protein [Saprospiraceae bacterium]